jgi:hypothetical protein
MYENLRYNTDNGVSTLSSLFLGKLIVTHHFNQFSIFYAIQRFIAVFITDPYRELIEQNILTPYSFKASPNIILPFIPRSPKWSVF